MTWTCLLCPRSFPTPIGLSNHTRTHADEADRFITPKPVAPAAWKLNAACRDLDLDVFFPLPADKAGIAAAKNICRRCPTKDDCLEEAIATSEQGVWGGTTDEERRRLVKRRRWGVG